MTPLQQFRIDELERFKAEHPTTPYPESFFRKTDFYNDKKHNSLIQLIIRFLKFHGHQAEKINTTGKPVDRSKLVSDVLGRHYKVGGIEWVKGTGTPGSSDVSAVIRGRAVKIEAKTENDSQSDKQKEYQRAIEQAGGVYWLVYSFDDLYNQYTEFLTKLI